LLLGKLEIGAGVRGEGLAAGVAAGVDALETTGGCPPERAAFNRCKVLIGNFVLKMMVSDYLSASKTGIFGTCLHVEQTGTGLQKT
jgi:hypothetical protein